MIQFRLISNYLSELDDRMKKWQADNPVLLEDEKKEEFLTLRKIPANRVPFRLKKSGSRSVPKSSH